MRCPYCGGLNAENSSFCRNCGRDLIKSPHPIQQPVPRQQPQRPIYPPPQPPQPVMPPRIPPQQQQGPAQTPHPAPPIQAPQTPRTRARQRTTPPPQTFQAPTQPVEPEAPVPFPPRSVAQLKALEGSALDYTLINDDISNKRKRVVVIRYQRCTGWQQVATLYKALREFEHTKFSTIVIQGIVDQSPNVYGFTNGQLTFDRDVRLGSQLLQRYQIETGNGYEGDAIRIVLSEEQR